MNLLNETQRLLEESDLSLEEIAKGAGVGFYWLQSFKRRLHREPSVVKVQALHDFLIGGGQWATSTRKSI